jgi:hypothetical protein
MYEGRNNEARACNHCCTGKAINIMYCECVSLALVINHAMLMRHIVVCACLPVRFYNIFTRYLTNGTNFEKKNIIERKTRVLNFSTTFF